MTGAVDGLTVIDAVRAVMSLQSMDGVYTPGLMLVGRLTVTTHSPGLPVGFIGIRCDSPSVVPNSHADLAVGVLQVIVKVTLSPGVAADGVTLTTGPCAKAGAVRAGTAAAARVAAPASVSVVAAERMKRIRKFPRSYAGPPRATSRVCMAAAPSGTHPRHQLWCPVDYSVKHVTFWERHGGCW